MSLVGTACGGSDSTAESGKEADSTGKQESSGSGLFPEAEKANAEFETRPTSIGLKTPVAKPIPGGKKIAFVQCGVPACETEAGMLKEATDLLDWTLKPIPAGVTPESIQAAWEQAIREKPDAVVSSGFPRALYEKQLEKLGQMKIPVIQAYVADEPGNGLTAVVAGREASEIEGRGMADYILANSDSDEVTAGLIYVNGFETTAIVAESLQAELEKQCPGCSAKSLEVPVASIGSDLPQRITSFFTSNPEIEWSQVAFNDMIVGLPTALKGAGIENVNLLTLNLNPAIAPYMEKGEYLKLGFSIGFAETYWREIDLLARYFNGENYEENMDDATLPFWAVTAENLPSTTEEFPTVANYQQQYKELWGLE
jgi:ribose transport system substrate-binding protein